MTEKSDRILAKRTKNGRRQIMKKILTALCVLLIAALTLAGCGGPYSGRENEVRDILLPLLEKDVVLNSYIWGEGFAVSGEIYPKDESSTTAVYYTVSADSPYKSCKELRDAAKEIYSQDMMKIIEAYAFENNDNVMSRFCDATEGNVLLKIDVSQNHKPYRLTAKVFPDTLKVTRSTQTIIECEIEYVAGSSQTRRTMKIKLLSEGSVWKLDSQTWAVEIG